MKEEIYLNLSPSEKVIIKNCLYDLKCLCRDESFFIKPPKSSDISEGKRFAYPKEEEQNSISFQIKYEKVLTVKAKQILKTFKNKYIYYAIDDIISILLGDEKENLLTVLYSSMLWLHNNLCINFFDIWIGEIFIHEEKKKNRFLEEDLNYAKLLTLKLYYKTRLPFKKPETLW